MFDVFELYAVNFEAAARDIVRQEAYDDPDHIAMVCMNHGMDVYNMTSDELAELQHAVMKVKQQGR